MTRVNDDYVWIYAPAIMKLSPLRFKLWLWMVLNASPRDSDDNCLKKGQFHATIETMREEMGRGENKKPSIRTIKAALEYFEGRSMINWQRKSRGLLITICDFVAPGDFDS